MYSSVYDVTYDMDSSAYLLLDIINHTSYLHTPIEFRCMIRSYWQDDEKVNDIIRLVGTLKPIRIVPTKKIAGVAKTKLQTPAEVIQRFLNTDNIVELLQLDKAHVSDDYIKAREKNMLGIA